MQLPISHSWYIGRICYRFRNCTNFARKSCFPNPTPFLFDSLSWVTRYDINILCTPLKGTFIKGAPVLFIWVSFFWLRVLDKAEYSAFESTLNSSIVISYLMGFNSVDASTGLYSFSRCWLLNRRNSEKIRTYIRSRSSKTIDLGKGCKGASLWMGVGTGLVLL